ncbi:MAG: pilus assembly protein [Planctomycetes bacterium]|nr:pilus assembly protein [Planctomycetota bacterium]
MALSAPTTGPRGLKELWADEDGTASVEFLVLLPAYLIFIAASISLALLVMSHQAAQQAARVDGWLDGKNSGVVFSVPGSYDPGTLQESNPDLDAELSAGNRNLLNSLLTNQFGTGGHPITQRRRTVVFTYQSILIGRASLDLDAGSSVYTFTEGFEYPAHERGGRDHYFAKNAALRPPFDPAEAPNNTYLSRRVNRHFSTNEGIWDTSPMTGRIDGSVAGEHRLYAGQRP